MRPRRKAIWKRARRREKFFLSREVRMAQTISISTDDHVFVLTGAGISAESGLPTFRAADGLWEGHRIEDVCTPEAWDRNAELVWQFYSARREAAEKAQPNPGHLALAKLESELGERYLLCTQNV